MAAGPQYPRFQLPGTEYFGLAQNQTLALSGRRRHRNALPQTALPAGAVADLSQTLTIENPFPRTAGIYIVTTWAQLLPADSSAELEIVSSRLGIGPPAAPAAFSLGVPLATQLTPAGGQNIITDRDVLALYRDIEVVSTAPPNILQFSFDIFLKNNDSTNAHSAAVEADIIYHLIYGFTE